MCNHILETHFESPLLFALKFLKNQKFMGLQFSKWENHVGVLGVVTMCANLRTLF
jgi:hypothetical protein